MLAYLLDLTDSKTLITLLSLLIGTYVTRLIFISLRPASPPLDDDELPADPAKVYLPPPKKTTSTKMAFQVDPNLKLDPPKDDVYSKEQLAQFNGAEDKPGKIYVAIKGTIFDVSRKRDMYGPGCGYNVFAGKDGSKGLGMSSLKPEHAVSDWSDLDEKDTKTLHQWFDYFQKRYNIVGKVKL